MSLDASTLRSSFDLVIERQPQMTDRFYEILFTRYPQAQPLFGRNSRAKQGEMLQQALAAVLDRLDDAPWLTATLGAMGRKHIDYGVTPEMYDWVGDSLLATLAEIAAEAWTPTVARAWTDAYTAISSLMLQGAAEAEAEAAAPQVATAARA